MSKLIKKENIVVVTRTYQDQQGKNKNVYKNIGEILTFSGEYSESKKVELYFMPGANISVFEQKENAQRQENSYSQSQKHYEETISVDNIPF